jgi:hemerythrin superfamily protein
MLSTRVPVPGVGPFYPSDASRWCDPQQIGRGDRTKLFRRIAVNPSALHSSLEEVVMKEPVAYEDAVDLLDADHKAVKKMFIDFGALVEDDAPAEIKQALVQRICQAVTVHAQIEEEIFYPEVRKAIGDDALMDEALAEHAEVKETIARIGKMKPTSAEYDDIVKQLGKLIDEHVLEEREQVFLQARRSPLDLRGLVLPLLKRQQHLKRKSAAAPAKVAA